MGIFPDQFWALTPYEFGRMIDGHAMRVKEEQRLLAWQTAYLLRPHIKNPVTASELMGEVKRKPILPPEALKRSLKDLDGSR